MSDTSMTTTNSLTLKKWAAQGWENSLKQSAVGYAANNGIIYFAKDFIGGSARGDELTYSYLNKLTGIPQGEGGTLEGNEEALDLGNFKIKMGIIRHGVSSPDNGTIEQQRTNVNFAEAGSKMVMKRIMEYLDTSFFYQLAGSDPTSFTEASRTWSGTNKTFVQGLNTVSAPSTNRVVRPNSAATDQALTSSDKMSLDMVTIALEKNAASEQPLEPLDDGNFAMFLSPQQIVDLIQDSAGKNQWYLNQQAYASGGSENQMAKPKMGNSQLSYYGTWQGVNIFQAPRVAVGVNSSTSAGISTVKRGLLLGKNAAVVASTKAISLQDKGTPFEIYESIKDNYYKTIEGRFIGGLKKNTPSNGEDIGVIVLSTYAASHS